MLVVDSRLLLRGTTTPRGLAKEAFGDHVSCSAGRALEPAEEGGAAGVLPQRGGLAPVRIPLGLSSLATGSIPRVRALGGMVPHGGGHHFPERTVVGMYRSSLEGGRSGGVCSLGFSYRNLGWGRLVRAKTVLVLERP